MTLPQAVLVFVAVSLVAHLAETALPGSRYGAAVWKLPGSTVYIYGGYGIGSDAGQQGHLNDMWLYNHDSNSWEFIHGSPDVYVGPSYGEFGAPSDSNTPGGLRYACSFYNNDGLWLFGGSPTEGSYTDDMWQYILSANQWMWLAGSKGPTTTAGVYEDFGSATSSIARPGPREGAMCWTDPVKDRFGMFGGKGIGDTDGVSGLLSDLWAYTPGQGQWGWVSGNSNVDATTTALTEQPSTDIYPPGTFLAGAWGYDSDFGTELYFGFGTRTGSSEFGDELWRFQANTGEWTLRMANEEESNAVTNRTGAAIWGSATDSTAWIFGGYGIDAPGNEGYYLGDLTFYDALNNQYTRIGDSPSQRNGEYGEKGVASKSNYPGSRAHAATWSDQSGNLWLYGGIGFDSASRDPGLLNDVWKYDTTERTWTWVGGSQFANTAGNYDPKATEPGVQLPPDAPAAKGPSPDQLSPISGGAGTPGTPSSNVGNAPIEPDSGLTRNQIIGIGVGIGVGGPLVAGAIVLAVLLQKRKANKKEGKSEQTSDSTTGDKRNTDVEQGNYNTIPAVNTATNGNANYGKIEPVALDNSTVNSDAKMGGADNRFIPYSSVTLEKEIGVGSYGKVYLGKLRTTKVAVKVANTKISQEEFIREANFQLSIPPHPNIVQLLGISIDGPEPLVVLEYCNEGSLDKLLFETEKNWTPAEQINLAAAIARGLDHLHQNNIVHRDLAVRNILLHHGEPKISDFGMSRKLKEVSQVGKTATNIGPIRWMAPEALGKQTYSTKSDVWTFGILLYEIVARQEPHADEDLINVAVKIRDAAYTPPIPDNCPELLRDVMQQCWKSDPAERPDMSVLCEMLDTK